MSLSVKARVSDIVQYQLPEFITQESPMFTKFLEAYYRFMERPGEPYDILRRTLDIIDVDRINDALNYIVTDGVYSDGKITFTIGYHSIHAGDTFVVSNVNHTEPNGSVTVTKYNGVFSVFSVTENTVICKTTVDPGVYPANVTGTLVVDNSINIKLLQFLKNQVVPISLENTDATIDDAFLIKFIKDLYLTKGSEESFRFIFDKFYNVTATMSYNRDMVFKTSDNQYTESDVMIFCDEELTHNYTVTGAGWGDGILTFTVTSHDFSVGDVINVFDTTPSTFNGAYEVLSIGVNTITVVKPTDPGVYFGGGFVTYNLNGEIIYQNETNSQSYIDEVNLYQMTEDGAYYYCTIKPNTGNTFFDSAFPVKADIISNASSTPITLNFRIVKVITSVSITDTGALYTPDNLIEILGGSGKRLKCEVYDISHGTVDEAIILQHGSGFLVGDKFDFFSRYGDGGGAVATVTGVDGSGAKCQLVMEISTVTILDGGVGYAVNDYVNLPLLDRTGNYPLAQVTGASQYLSRIEVVDSGKFSLGARAMITDGVSHAHWFTTPIFATLAPANPLMKRRNTPTSIISDILLPSQTIQGPATVQINGSGCMGTLSFTPDSNGGSYTVNFTNHGLNYVNPVIRYLTKVSTGVTTSLIPLFGFTISDEAGGYSISSITPFGVWQLENNTSYSFVVEESENPTFNYISHYAAVTSLSLISRGEYIKLPNDFFTVICESVGNSDGYGLVITPTLRVKTAEVVSGGMFYESPTVVATGLLAGDSVSIGQTQGVITSFTFSGAGTGYTDVPTIEIVNAGKYQGRLATIEISNGGNYKYLPKINLGNHLMIYDTTLPVDYDYATLLGKEIVQIPVGFSDGVSAKILKVDYCYSDTINGHADTQVWRIKIDKSSGLFYESSAITSDGHGVDIILPAPAKVVVSSTSIGKINSVKVTDHGINYDQVPVLVTPICAIVDNTGPAFRQGEQLYNPDFQRRLGDVVSGTWTMGVATMVINHVYVPSDMKVGDRIFIGSIPASGYDGEHTLTYVDVGPTQITVKFNLQDPVPAYSSVGDVNVVYNGTYLNGPHGWVKSYNNDTNEIVINNASDDFYIVTENGIDIVTEAINVEDQFDIVHEFSYGLLNTKVKGLSSGVEANIIRMYRANLIANNGTFSKLTSSFYSYSGFLSNMNIKLHNGYDVQDYAYTITIRDDYGYDLNFDDYKAVVTTLAHPAGYKMFGKNLLETYFIDTPNIDWQPINLFVKLDPFGNEVAQWTLYRYTFSTMSYNMATYFTPQKLEDNKFRYDTTIHADYQGYAQDFYDICNGSFRDVTFDMFNTSEIMPEGSWGKFYRLEKYNMYSTPAVYTAIP